MCFSTPLHNLVTLVVSHVQSCDKMEWKGRLYRFRKKMNGISTLCHRKDSETLTLMCRQVCGPQRVNITINVLHDLFTTLCPHPHPFRVADRNEVKI